MGFYAPAQVVRDAREHGVEVRPVCVNASRWDCTLEPGEGGALAVRLGLRLVLGLANAEAARLVAGRGTEPYRSVEELWRRTGLAGAALARLAEADAFQEFGLDRRQALWAVRGLGTDALPLFAAADRGGAPAPEVVEPTVPLAPMTAGAEVVADYRSLGLSLRRHPVAFLRGDLEARGLRPCGDLATLRDGQWVAVGGMVLVRQRPGSASGVLFVTIEDEIAVANLVIWPDVFERQRRIILSAGLLACHGRLQREGEVIHVIARRLVDLSDLLQQVGAREVVGPVLPPDGKPVLRPACDRAIAEERSGVGIRVPARNFR